MKVSAPVLSDYYQQLVTDAFGEKGVTNLNDARVEAVSEAIEAGRDDVVELLGEGWSQESDTSFLLMEPSDRYAGKFYERLSISQEQVCLEAASYSHYMGLGVRETLTQSNDGQLDLTKQEFVVDDDPDLPEEPTPR